MSVIRALLIYEILKKNTNNINKLTINELMDELKSEGYNVTRNTVRSDINLLIDAKYNIIEEKCRSNTSCYYYESEFTIEECRIILDSLYSNKFIRNDYKRNIKEKILSNISYRDRIILRNSIVTEAIENLLS